MRFVGNEWLRRLDAHLERGNELFERGNELFERNERAFERFVEADERNTEAFHRNTEAFNRMMAAFDRWEAREDEHREFMREIILRVERGGREHLREIRQMGDEMVAEIRAELSAGRGALLAILNRLPPPPDGEAPAG